MLLREAVAVRSKKHKKPKIQNAALLIIKAAGTYNYH
jgi:hypothetical protein